MTAVVLVGLMGAGKSSVGSVVAARMGVTFVDVDVAIVGGTGKTVRELWEQGGEPAYRYLESKVVLDTLAEERDVVLAAPGGVVLDPAVRAALADAFVVWLRTNPATLAVVCDSTTIVRCWARTPGTCSPLWNMSVPGFTRDLPIS